MNIFDYEVPQELSHLRRTRKVLYFLSACGLVLPLAVILVLSPHDLFAPIASVIHQVPAAIICGRVRFLQRYPGKKGGIIIPVPVAYGISSGSSALAMAFIGLPLSKMDFIDHLSPTLQVVIAIFAIVSWAFVCSLLVAIFSRRLVILSAKSSVMWAIAISVIYFPFICMEWSLM